MFVFRSVSVISMSVFFCITVVCVLFREFRQFILLYTFWGRKGELSLGSYRYKSVFFVKFFVFRWIRQVGYSFFIILYFDGEVEDFDVYAVDVRGCYFSYQFGKLVSVLINLFYSQGFWGQRDYGLVFQGRNQLGKGRGV